MQFKQYPSYKNSGVEWLGDVPEHWYIFKSNKIFKQSNVRSYESDEQLTASQKYGVIPQSLYMKKEESKVVLALSGIDNFKHVDKNDFVISLRSFQGGIELCFYDGCVSPAYTVLKPNKVINYSFWSYLFKSTIYISVLNTAVDGIREGKTISYTNFGKIYINIPPLSEQAQIANYLDTETTRIDNLIAKQEKLIELLEEQRKSIISHAVTKGLNPNAPMKDSGVEWLGEVPEHWDVAVVKRAFIVKLGKMLQPDQKDETDVIKKYLKASNLTWDGVKDIDNEMWFSKNDLKKLKLEIGDLLVAEGGDVGKSCIFDSNEEFYYQNSVNRVRGQKNNANEFLYYWLFTLKYSGYIDILCNKSTIAHFTAEKLNETILLLPDSVEQNEIIAYLERENGKINQLILKQQSLIEKLKEYRASIISHAVTGKIDVREFGA